MDIFLNPETSIRLIDQAEYFCDDHDRWDGGPFLTYAHRKGILHLIPPGLRHPDPKPDIPYTELIHPTSLVEQHKIFTTWFFFGLLAEFIGSNRQSNPGRPPDNTDAEENQRQIYEYFVTAPIVIGQKQEGTANEQPKRYLTAKLTPHLVPMITETITTNPDRQSRLNYLGQCLNLTSQIIANTISKSFNPALKFAISGLGEFLAVVLQIGLAKRDFGPNLTAPMIGFDWKRDYLSPETPFRHAMVTRGGWCKSDLGRANSVYQRLSTAHYLSLLERHIPGRDHDGCTETTCLAAQIDNNRYKLSHAEDCTKGGGCEEFKVNIAEVKRVLLESQSYPILVFEQMEGGEVGLVVREYEKEKDEYIALSHVWADGLGNTQGNTLQKCQIARLSRLIKAVEDAVHTANPSKPRPTYHLWIDTLCCPVAKLEPLCNGISLTRMKTVYEQATHVLVLDLALSVHDAEPLHPATLLLRIFASSIWMRRLWTLQEGVLAHSLFFQFKDKPVHAKSLMDCLMGSEDFRHKAIGTDISMEWNRLNDLNSGQGSVDEYPHKMYRRIQGALDFRAVTYASDEPICIATLLGLDLRMIIGASGPLDDEPTRAEKRMCMLWKLLAEADVDGIPSRIIFAVDDPLKSPGFGWAPRSLLGSSQKGGDWVYKSMGITWEGWDARNTVVGGGFLTPYGLAVDLPALVLEARPLSPGMGLHDWDGVLGPHEEDMVYFYHQEAETWYRMVDWHSSSAAPPETTVRDMKDYSLVPSRPLCSAIDSGRIALIQSEWNDPHNAMLWLMVQMLDDGPVRPPGDLSVSKRPGRRARWLRKVIVSQVHGLELMVLQTMRKVAGEVADDEREVTAEFVRSKGLGTESVVYQAARENLRQKMKDKMAQAWKNEAGFAQAVGLTIEDGMEEYIWASTPKSFSHERMARKTPVDQRWFID